MDQFDKMLKERAEKEPFPIPEGYAGRVFATCAALEETEEAPRRKSFHYRWTGWIAAALALFIAVPNASPAAAAAMADVPVLGAIVELVTFRRYTYDDGRKSADIAVPELGGGAAAQEVNDQVRAYTDQLLAQFREDCREEGGEAYHSLDTAYRVVTDTDRWFTLRIDTTETQASGYETSRFYHIDKTTGETVTLGDLFREDADYVSALSGEVRRQMEARNAESGTEDYFPEDFAAIDPAQNFYWNEDGDLVLVFDEYTIAPGSTGMPEFTIPADVYGSLLK